MHINRFKSLFMISMILLLTESALPANPPIRFESVTVYDFYGEDGLLNPGEFVWLQLEITNQSNQTFDAIYGIPDRKFDPYVHPDSNYFFDNRLDRQNAPRPGETLSWDDLECYIASDTPNGHIITIPVTFFSHDNQIICSDTIRVPVHGMRDEKGPFFDAPWINTYSLSIGDTIVMAGKCWEAGDIYGVKAFVRNAQGEIVVIIDLHDNGLAADTTAGDRVFTGFWPVAFSGDFTVDFKGWDIYQNIGTHERFLNYTSHPVEPGDFMPVLATGISHAVIIQNITIENQPAEAGDQIGVFDGDLCVGAATYNDSLPLIIPAWMEYLMPGGRLLPGAHTGQPIQFRIRKESTGQIITAVPNYQDGDGCFNRGVSVIEHLATSAHLQSIDVLPHRFNLISFNIQPFDRSVETIFNDLTHLKIVKDDNGRFYIPEYGINTIDTIQTHRAYQFLSADDVCPAIINTGTPLHPEDITLSLGPDQSFMIPYPYSTAQPAEQVFQSIKNITLVLHDDRGGFWIPELGINTLGEIQPGQGLRIYVKKPVTFTYPRLASSLGKQKTMHPVSNTAVHYQFTESGLPYAFVIESSELPFNRGDEIALFDGDLCVGASVISEDLPLLITGWAGDPSYHISGFKHGNSLTLKRYSASAGEQILAARQNNTFKDTPFQLIQITDKITGIADHKLPSSFGLAPNFPNPFNGETTLTWQIDHAGQVDLVIYNLKGQEIARPVHGIFQPGIYHLHWNGKNSLGQSVESGVYLLRLQAGTKHTSRKMLLTR